MSKDPNKHSKSTKAEKIKTLLSRNSRASIAELIKVTDWQAHSVRGFISGTLKKKLGHEISSTREEGKPRRYFIAAGAK